MGIVGGRHRNGREIRERITWADDALEPVESAEGRPLL